MAHKETIDVPLERAYRDRTIVVLLAELGVRGAELYESGHSELAQSALRHKSTETMHSISLQRSSETRRFGATIVTTRNRIL